jgi:glycosyltransferase involved in cell wall biosynthesis
MFTKTPSLPPRLAWIYADSLLMNFNIAPRIEITRELRNMGWQVTLIAAGPSEIHQVQGVEILFLPRPEVYFLRQLIFHLKALSLLLQEWDKIDIILLQVTSAFLLIPLQFRRWLGKKTAPLLVVDTRTVPMELKTKASLKDRLRGEFQHFMYLLADCWADGQTAITKRLADQAHIVPDKLWGTWPSGVNLERFALVQNLHQWPLRAEPIQLIYIGVLHYERNLMALCRAVEKANACGMGFILTLIGSGTEQVDLEQFSKFTDGRIRIFPPVPHEQIPELLSQAHIGVLPFPNEEQFLGSSPIKLFEYMGAGLPILATRITCHTDVIENGAYVFWAEEATTEGLLAALNLIWEKRKCLEEMGQKASLDVKNWTWQESAKKLNAALEYGLSLNKERILAH